MSVLTPMTSARSTSIFFSAAAHGLVVGVFGDVEPVAGARQVKIRIRIEIAHELARVRAEIRFDREFRRERIFVAPIVIETDAREASDPFHRRTIRDHAELARDRHAGFGIMIVVVVAFLPIWIEPDRFALQRADRDGERLRLRRGGNADVRARAARVLHEIAQRAHAAHRIADAGRRAVRCRDGARVRTRNWRRLRASDREKSICILRRSCGSTDAGPVDPLQLPSEFTQMTNQRFVSMCLPGPSMSSHQPGDGSSAFAAACASGDSPVRIRIALSRAALSVPHVSYASFAPMSAPPRRIGNGEGRSKKRVASAMRHR